ncbi:hypothetical protein Moror_10216 [Moniliophthora roreri MCA 2997]|uniref:Uncharacterized protein n=1 Tax=Moniliophthora roreri (strain MCA 2997) TaxID=1381753 RepID=V2WBY4_MONRO|nr:hypothetical protein Moror_10216 [Moniliophthora roreri MCA 2997]
MSFTFRMTPKRVRVYSAHGKIHLEAEEFLNYDHDDEAERENNEKKMGIDRSGSNLVTVMPADLSITLNDPACTTYPGSQLPLRVTSSLKSQPRL